MGEAKTYIELQDELKALQAERDALAQRVSELEAEREGLKIRAGKLEGECDRLAAQLAAHTAARWEQLEVHIAVYKSIPDFNNAMIISKDFPEWNYHPHSWEVLPDGRVAVMWQRPARQEVEG